jgi:serine/threonine protein phosphatase PrpC
MSIEFIQQKQLLIDSNQKPWKVVSSSVAGTSHKKKGLPCQDAHHWELWSDDILVAAVADGAGSAAISDVGAKIAVSKVVETILQLEVLPTANDEKEWKSILTEALTVAKTCVETEANTRQVAVRDLASTLLVAVATPELAVTAQVGDGAIVISDKQNNIFALTTPQSGEYINQTTFLVSPNALNQVQMNIWYGNVANLAMFSDGLQMLALKMPLGTPHVPFFNPLFGFISQMIDESAAKKELEGFLKSPRVAQRSDDDLTILLASLKE